MKITQAERDAWLRRPNTTIFKWQNGWSADYSHRESDSPVCETKNAAINAAIRAERKEKR